MHTSKIAITVAAVALFAAACSNDVDLPGGDPEVGNNQEEQADEPDKADEPDGQSDSEGDADDTGSNESDDTVPASRPDIPTLDNADVIHQVPASNAEEPFGPGLHAFANDSSNFGVDLQVMNGEDAGITIWWMSKWKQLSTPNLTLGGEPQMFMYIKHEGGATISATISEFEFDDSPPANDDGPVVIDMDFYVDYIRSEKPENLIDTFPYTVENVLDESTPYVFVSDRPMNYTFDANGTASGVSIVTFDKSGVANGFDVPEDGSTGTSTDGVLVVQAELPSGATFTVSVD